MARRMCRRGRMQKVLFGCAAPTQFAARCNGGRGPISHLGFRAFSKSLVSVRIERTVRWLVSCTRGGRHEGVQDRDRAESTGANVATSGGGGHIVRRVLFGAGTGANQDRLWRIAH